MKSQVGAGRPRLALGVSLRALPIGPAEAFILSRIDGASTESDIIAATGLDSETVLTILRRLASLGAIDYPGDPPRSAAPSEAGHTEATRARADLGDPKPLDAPSGVFPPEELEEDVELSRTRRLCVLELFYRLGELDHYELLGLPSNANRQAVKDAYYGVVSLFHPDRYYGKRLGRFKHKLESIFARLTEAHEALSRSRARHDYDEGLARRSTAPSRPSRSEVLWRLHALIRSEARAGRPVEEAQHASGSPPDRVTRPDPIVARVDPTYPPPPASLCSHRADEQVSPQSLVDSRSGAVARARNPSSPTPGGSVATVDGARPPSTASSPPCRASIPAGRSMPPEERAKALARKLRRSTSSLPPPPNHDPIALHAAGVGDQLRSEFVRRTTASRVQQARRHIDAANESAAAGRWMAAANSMRLAAAVAPEDDEILTKLQELELRSARELRDAYIGRAREAEQNGQLAEAASLYEKAARSGPTPSILLKSAQCLLASNTELKRAASLAKHALSLNEAHVEAHVTLAKIYVAAGMQASAVFELERASTLMPNDASIRALLKQLKRNAS